MQESELAFDPKYNLDLDMRGVKILKYTSLHAFKLIWILQFYFSDEHDRNFGLRTSGKGQIYMPPQTKWWGIIINLFNKWGQ